MTPEEPKTIDLLERWKSGDPEALDRLLARDMDWISAYVHRRLNAPLRKFGDTEDFVQEAALRVLKYGPRFVLADGDDFRRLLAKIVLNLMRAKHRELFTLKRSLEREKSLGSTSVLYLDRPQDSATRPDDAAAHEEEKEWLRFGLLLLEPRDQEVIDLHWQGLTDAEIGARLGIQANTARMRRNRATSRLTKVVLQLKSGRLREVLAAG